MASAGIVLAAGGSRRMGRPKQLLPVGGRPLLEAVVAAACASRLDDVVVVVGAHRDDVLAAVDLGRARAVVNPGHAEGMGASLRLGLASVAGDAEVVAVVLGDQVGVDASLLDRLLDLHASTGLDGAAVERDGVLQPPVVLRRDAWPELARARGDTGLRSALRARPHRLARLAVAAGDIVDVDTPADYAGLAGGS